MDSALQQVTIMHYTTLLHYVIYVFSKCNRILHMFYPTQSASTWGGDRSSTSQRRQISLRIVVYDPKRASAAQATVHDYKDIRECVGPLHQTLLQSTGDSTQVYARACEHICVNRLTLVTGIDDEHSDDSQTSQRFNVVLLRSRLYSSIKETPIHLNGESDTQANAAVLIDEDTTVIGLSSSTVTSSSDEQHHLKRRGTKILRSARRINGALYQVNKNSYTTLM
jgi:hypothetical protein